MRGFVFGAGSFYGLQEVPGAEDYIVAADGGYITCLAEGITPSVVVGDFDSMDKPTDFANVVQVPVEKDDTDTMLGINLCIDNGCKEIYLYGVTGGKRLDHTLAVLQNLLYIRRQGCKGYVYDDEFVFTVIQGESLTLSAQVEWGLLSVFAVDGQAEGVSILGAQYTLEQGTLTAHVPLGVSNHFVGQPVTITVEKGALLVGWELPKRLPNDRTTNYA